MDLLAAAFSAMLGVEVVTPERAQSQQRDLPKVSVHQLFRATYVMRPRMAVEQSASGTSQEFEINLRTLTGTKIVIPVANDHTIAEIKAAVEQKEGVSATKQRLVFNSKILEDEDTVAGLGIPPLGTINLIFLGGADAATIFQLDPDELAPRYDYDFTNEVDDGSRFIRGGYVYHRPYGWRRFALNVKGRQEYGGGDSWLGPDGIRMDSTTSEWPVTYHGTYMTNVKGIVEEGLVPGWRKQFGPGVYSSPSIEMVSKYYAQEFEYGGKRYKVALQNRVNPAQPEHLKIIDMKDTKVGAEYWIAPLHDPSSGVYDIRPYGILVRQA